MTRIIVRVFVGVGLLVAVPYIAFVEGVRQTQVYFRQELVALPSQLLAKAVGSAYGCWALGLGFLVMGRMFKKRGNP
ncbi:MAG: hypothetical protein WCG06_04920 [Candidatus Omnitrophota bacterium]